MVTSCCILAVLQVGDWPSPHACHELRYRTQINGALCSTKNLLAMISKNQLPCVESLGVARSRIALDAPKAQVPSEQIRIEPLVVAL